MRLARYRAVLHARNLEFLRDRSSLAWNILLPVMIVVGFAFAFSGDPPALFKVGFHGDPARPAPELEFLALDHLSFVPVADLEAAVTKVQRHQLDMILDLPGERYWVNDDSPRGSILERVLAGAGGAALRKERVQGEAIRYVDWVLPGVLAMNMMFSALFGVGYVIVRYRKNGVLRRLRATPLTALEFLAAQITSRLSLILTITVLVFLTTDLLVDFRMYGSHLALLAVFALGAMCLISLGLTMATRTASEELAGGLLNLISWPMMFLSGVWFSLEGVHPLLQALSLVFPLTHVIDAARAIMIDGATLADVWHHLTVLLAMTVVCLGFSAWSFRWE